MGDRAPEREEHLRECAECAAELDRIGTPIGLLRGAVREWSATEDHGGVAIQRRVSTIGRAGGLWLRLAATAAALAVLVAIGIEGRNWRAAGIDREDEILLGEVQAAVSRPVPATMQPMYNLMVEEGVK
jgi:predicted anti-sigma-YlaC factor YlaD